MMAQYIRQQDHEEVERPSSPTSEVISMMVDSCSGFIFDVDSFLILMLAIALLMIIPIF